MCQCSQKSGVIAAEVFTGVALLLYIVIVLMISLIDGKGSIAPVGYILPPILLANQLVAMSVHIYYELDKTVEKLKVNWITYVATASLEFTLILSWLVVDAIDGGGSGGSVTYYILIGVAMFFKIPLNVVSAWNMITYYEKSHENGSLIRLDARKGYEGLTLIVMK